MEKHFLQLHVTHECNLRCAHCYQEEYRSHMTRELFEKVLDRYGRYVSGRGMRGQINLTGGEPLMHPDFAEMTAEIKRRGFILSILTNGTLIDEGRAELIAELKPLFVQISLDGTESSHDAIRGSGSYKKALCGIDELKRRNVRVLVSFTAQKGNVSELKELVKVCRRHGVDKLWWDRVVSEDTERLALSTEEFLTLADTAGRIAGRDRLLHRPELLHNCRSLQFVGDGRSGGYHCTAGKELLVVTADGSIMPCRRLPFVIGNIVDGEIRDILGTSELMKSMRELHIPDKCLHCKDFYRCGGGSKCVTYAQTGKLFAPDVNCPY